MNSQRLVSRLWYALVRNLCGLVFRLGFRFQVLGAENVPKTGAVLVLSNHASHLDPVLVGVASPRRLRFLARGSLFFWPLSWLIGSLGAVPIDREGSGLSGLRATLKILKQQEALVMFPEGTRSADGQLQPLKPGFCAVARRSRAQLAPVGIAGSFGALPRGRLLPRPSKITLQFGMPISPEQIAELTDEQLVELVRDRIAEAWEMATAG